MGSTNISSLAGMFVQEQTKITGQADLKTNDAANRFQEYMQQMSARVTGELVSGQGQSADMAVKSVSVKESGNESPDRTAVDYENSGYHRTEIKRMDDAAEGPDRQEVAQETDAYAEKVKDVLKEEFGVTDEQIAQAMETLGLTVLDLMNPNQLAALAAELTGAAEPGDMLFDAGFLQLMQEVDTLSKELLQELGISKEELIALFEAAEPIGEQTVPEEVQGAVQTSENISQEQVPTERLVTGEQAAIDRGMDSDNGATNGQQDLEVRTTISAETAEQPKDQTAEAAGNDAKPVTSEVQEKTEPIETMQGQETVKEAKTEENVPMVQEEAAEELPQKETHSGDGQALSQNQDTANGQGEHAAQLVHHVETAEVSVTAAVPEQTGYSEQVDVTNIIREIVEFTRIHVSEQTTTLQMQLNPEHLGKVMLELTAKEGAVTARIFAQNEMVREALEAQMVEVRQNMNQAGIKVEAIEVTVESHEFERNLEQQANQERQQAEEQEKSSGHNRRINLMDAESLDALTGMMSEEEALVAQIMADRGNSVDFMA